MKRKFFAVMIIFFALMSSCYAREYSSSELLNMTRESLHYDRASNTAHVKGFGRVINNNAQGVLLARRAALTDARRGLLILKRELKSGKRFESGKVSGHVPALRILSEGQQGDLYFVEVEAALSEVLNNKYYTYMIIKL